VRYRHPQFGQVIVVSLGLTAVLLGGLGGALGERAIAVGGPLMMGVAARLFYALTVEIDATHLTFRFGIELIRKRVPLAEIVEAKPVRNAWIDGWGIHRTPHGGLYHVSGGEAVEIALASGKRFRLGTDEPRWLAQILLAAKGGRSALARKEPRAGSRLSRERPRARPGRRVPRAC
jgi:hypothetical protein